MELALEHAQKAVALDDTEAEAHWVLAASLTHVGKPQVALVEYERALALSPNNADLLAQYGWSLPYLGRAGEAVESINKAMRLNPIYPEWYSMALMDALYTARRYEEVIAVSNTINSPLLVTHLLLAGSYAYSGQLDDAHISVANVLELKPDFSLRQWREKLRFEHPADLEHYIDGLRKAGLPE